MRLIDPIRLKMEIYMNNILERGKTLEEIIDNVPDYDAAPVVHGRWIYDGGDEYADHYHCDKCGTEIDLCNEVYTEPKPNYCKNCGAKMDQPDR